MHWSSPTASTRVGNDGQRLALEHLTLGDVQPGVEIAMERYAIDGGGQVDMGFEMTMGMVVYQVDY